MNRYEKFDSYIFGCRLSEVRKESGKTQQVLADDMKAAGFNTASREKIKHYECGARLPKADELFWLSGYFSVSADYLLGLSDIPSTEPDEIAAIEFTGLSNECVAMLNRSFVVPDMETFPKFVNSLVWSDKRSELFKCLKIIQNMIERINNYEETKGSADYSSTLPDSKDFVTITPYEFFGYYCKELADIVSASFKQWCLNEVGLEEEKDCSEQELPF